MLRLSTLLRSTIPALKQSTRCYATAPASLNEGEKVIWTKLSEKFPGKRLEVQDVSGGCGSFYAIEISSPAFKGLSTIKQHKLVNACLKEDIAGIHGLQLKTIPEE
ncbi:BolA-like protein 3, partial [Tremellales sp. Uapishka_1]